MTKKVSDEKVHKAVKFLFPDLDVKTKAYEAIKEFINQEFEKLQTAVLWFRNNDFVDILKPYGLKIGTKEIILTPGAVLASEHYNTRPRVIYGHY